MKIFELLLNISLRNKLIAVMLASCMIPLAIVTTTYMVRTADAIEQAAFTKLESLRDTRKVQIESYFEQVRNQIITFSENRMVIDAMSDFRRGFNALPEERQLSSSELDNYRRKLSAFYENDFAREYLAKNDKSIGVDHLLPSGEAGLIAQYDYIANNPNQLGNKGLLDSAADSSSYSNSHAEYHPVIRSYLNKFGYYDIFLVDPSSAQIVYSVFKEIDYAGSLTTGPHSDSGIARAFKQALSLRQGDSAALVDFAFYLPSYDAPAMFIASPIYQQSDLIGVAVFQVQVSKIDEVMGEPHGLGETGETFLVGDDFLMRSQSRFEDQNTILARTQKSQAIVAAIDGKTGSSIVEDVDGVTVLSSYTDVDIGGLDWVMAAEVHQDEAMAAMHGLVIGVGITCALVAVFSIAMAYFLARSVMRQLGAEPVRLSAVAEAIANDDLRQDLSTSKPATGVMAMLQRMQLNLRQRIESDRQMLNENGRIRQALNNVSSIVTIADKDFNIVYMNQRATQLFKEAEADFRSELPNFNASNLIGASIDTFHKNPEHQRRLLGNLQAEYVGDIKLGGRSIKVIANPVFDTNGERLGSVVEWQDRTQEVVIEDEVQRVVNNALAGDLSSRIRLDNRGDRDGFFENLSDGVNQLVTVADQIIQDTVRVLAAMAEGDLTKKIESEYEGSFGTLKRDANSTIERLTEVVGNIKVSAGSVKTGAGEISQGNSDLSQRTEEQTSSLEETASSMEEMTSTVRQNADNASQANELAQSARQQAEKGGEVVKQAVTAMAEINSSSKKIADIIGVIDEIAFQTNLLALNASVEAARAGEQGRGFAVVASEVRNLAGRSATAAKEIKDLIQDSEGKVEEGSRLVNASGDMLEEIVGGVKKVTDIVGEIAAASQEQSSGIEEVSKAINQMDQLTQQNAALVEEAAAASESLGTQADDLYVLMDFFTVDSAADSTMPVILEPQPDVVVERRSEDRPWSEPPSEQIPASNAAPSSAAGTGTDDQEWEEF